MTVLNKKNSDERKKFLESRPILQPGDIADGLIYVLSTPEHVQVKINMYIYSRQILIVSF